MYIKAVEWLNSLKDYEGETGEFFCGFVVNYPPFKGLVIEVRKQNVIFYKRDFLSKVYFPEKIEYAYVKDSRRRMLTVKTEKFWAYDEQVGNVRTVSFGTDMTMPFLKEQNWETV